MRQVLIATMIASLLAGCGTTPTAPKATLSRLNNSAPASSGTAPSVSLQPVLTSIPGYAGPAPSVTVGSAVHAAQAKLMTSQDAAAKLVAADSNIDSVELLIQNGGAYLVQGWFSDLVTKVKETYRRWKLSRQVKAELKASLDKAAGLHAGEIDALKKNRTAPVTKIAKLDNGDEQIVTTWTSTSGGTFTVSTSREVDSDGVTQVMSVTTSGTDKSGAKIDTSRIRTLTGTDGTYQVATKRTTIDKSGTTSEEWLKIVNADGTEKITGFIVRPDGYQTDITGTRDANGKVSVNVTHVAPASGSK